MQQEIVDDMKLYLRDEGLDDSLIKEFFESHEIWNLDEDEGWEVIESHIFRDTDLSVFPE